METACGTRQAITEPAVTGLSRNCQIRGVSFVQAWPLDVLCDRMLFKLRCCDSGRVGKCSVRPCSATRVLSNRVHNNLRRVAQVLEQVDARTTTTTNSAAIVSGHSARRASVPGLEPPMRLPTVTADLGLAARIARPFAGRAACHNQHDGAERCSSAAGATRSVRRKFESGLCAWYMQPSSGAM